VEHLFKTGGSLELGAESAKIVNHTLIQQHPKLDRSTFVVGTNPRLLEEVGDFAIINYQLIIIN
jgi:hypothetical protein